MDPKGISNALRRASSVVPNPSQQLAVRPSVIVFIRIAYIWQQLLPCIVRLQRAKETIFSGRVIGVESDFLSKKPLGFIWERFGGNAKKK